MFKKAFFLAVMFLAAGTAALWSTSAAIAAPTQITTFTWNKYIYAGDCIQTDVQAVIGNDGSGHFTSTVYTTSTHGKDVWWSGLSLKDKDGVVLQVIPTQKGPDMSDGNGGPSPRYHLNYDFTFTASLFTQVSEITEFSKC